MSCSVLIVDEREAGPRGVDRLVRSGVDVTTVTSVGFALERVRRGARFDAVLVSIATAASSLPVLSDLDALGARVVLVAPAGGSTAAERMLLQAAIFPYLLEPLDAREVVRAVRCPTVSIDDRPSLL